MELIPAIDLLGGKCVRLTQGKFDDVEYFSDNPAATAQRWKGAGAPRLHVVDLDGARQGKPANREAIKQICQAIDIPIQVGGGIRTVEDVMSLIELGVDRVIVGTAACRNPELVRRAVQDFQSHRIWVALDCLEGRVAVSGWQENTPIRPTQVAKQMEQLGAGGIIFTDISRDGAMQGIDVSGLRLLTNATKLPLIMSGGVSTMDDIRKLTDPQWTTLSGVIIGKALYKGAIKYEQALELLRA